MSAMCPRSRPWRSRAACPLRTQKRTSGLAVALSAKGPITEVATLFDHFVRACEQRGRNSETERLGGLQIDHQFVERRLQDRHFGGI